MSLRHVVLVVVLTTAAVGVGAAFVAGVGPAPGSPGPAGTGTPIEEFPTESSTSDGNADAPAPAFDSRIERIESCGTTCRDVTATVANDGNATAEGVVVYTRIYAGEDTEGEVLWEDRRSVGTLPAGESVTDTERVTLSYEDALAIRRADGQVTVLTTVQSENVTATGTQHLDLS